MNTPTLGEFEISRTSWLMPLFWNAVETKITLLIINIQYRCSTKDLESLLDSLSKGLFLIPNFDPWSHIFPSCSAADLCRISSDWPVYLCVLNNYTPTMHSSSRPWLSYSKVIFKHIKVIFSENKEAIIKGAN